MMEIDNSEELGQKDKGNAESDLEELNDEGELRLGGDRQMSNESGDERMAKGGKPMLAGEKRKRQESEEEEDMDFEAIENEEMKKQKFN